MYKIFSCVLEWMFWLSYNIPVGLLSYRKHPLISQQLLTIQEELNNKKSELEQAKEEQSHTQALLKVLQEQVSESHSSDPRISLNTDTRFPVFDACANTGWSYSLVGLAWTIPTSQLCCVGFLILSPASLFSLWYLLGHSSLPAICETFFQKTDEFWLIFKTLAMQINFRASS